MLLVLLLVLLPGLGVHCACACACLWYVSELITPAAPGTADVCCVPLALSVWVPALLEELLR